MNENRSNNETNFVWVKNKGERQKVSIWQSKWVLILIWHWLSTQIDCEWDWSTTNLTRSLIKHQNKKVTFCRGISWLGTSPYGEKQKRCVYGLGFGRKRPNPRPSPNKAYRKYSRDWKNISAQNMRFWKNLFGFNLFPIQSLMILQNHFSYTYTI